MSPHFLSCNVISEVEYKFYVIKIRAYCSSWPRNSIHDSNNNRMSSCTAGDSVFSWIADISSMHPFTNGVFHHINMSLSEVGLASKLISVPWILEFLKSANKLPLDNPDVQDIVKKLFEIYW